MPERPNSSDLVKLLEQQKYAMDQSAIVVQTDRHGTIQYVNDKFCEISGYTRGELLGKNHRIVNSQTHTHEFFAEMWKTISAGKIWKGEICNRAKSGRLYWVATTIVPFLDADGKPYEYLAIRQDITDLKLAQKQIQEQQDQLLANSKLSAIGEMAAAITHEINNPLGVILGRCEMIKTLIARGDVDLNNLSRLVDTIEITGQRIEKIVKSMKALSHQGDEDPKLKCLVEGILQDLVDLFSQRFRNEGAELSIKEYDKSLFVYCRSHEILQVLVNLLNNSLDAIASLEQKWVRIEIKDKGSEVEISVTDSGNGIPANFQEKLFTPFQSSKRVQYGTGLGLSISRNLVQRHHGTLEYDRFSPFTRFVMTLPKKAM